MSVAWVLFSTPVATLNSRRVEFLGAVLNAPVFVTGLTETELNVVRARALATLHPEETKMQHELTKALNEVRGVAATERALLERCEMRDDQERTLATCP
ncbi:hypothetical protein [Bradyrhizobium sp. CSS354]|uniref:hypothetical protein n=1 Tax=Bradyrhizobium sp. CSS354 TaxID=2699172 RepID=UPI0023AFF20A|nr:hypothetical protein [Bradyrhizobium sp. CSS354]MDE5466335.1 hypothetical protein [Bradyrhizobium sp. CSS354]